MQNKPGDGEISMKYRSRTDIQACILEAGCGGASKTRLMYKAFLSYIQTIAYMTELLERGMLEYDSSEDIYRTSTRGMDFLKSLQATGRDGKGLTTQSGFNQSRTKKITVPFRPEPIKNSS